MAQTSRTTRRRTFLRGGAAAAASLSLARWSGPAGSVLGAGAGARPGQAEPTTLTPADFAGLGPCRLLPEQTQGPFYTDLDLVRRDITEGLPGHPLRLGLRVVDPSCNPVPGAVVDVWHADAEGDYSAFADGSGGNDAGPGTRFLRGVQTANDEGIVEFRTLYPGWYTGRAVHIHLKVHVGERTVLTTQLYFPEDVTDRVHAQAPYAARGTRDTRNETDFIAGDPAAQGTLLTTSPEGAGTRGLAVLGVSGCTAFERWWYWLIGQPERCG